MEEQTTLENFGNLNQNSASLHPEKVEIVDTSDNVLSEGEHVEDEDGNIPASLMHEKRVSEASSATDMTTSTSHDTGFGSASVSEISSPVENNDDEADKTLSENTANKADGESYNSGSDEETDENDENTLNNKTSDENLVNTAPKSGEDGKNEKEAHDEAEDENIENKTSEENKDENGDKDDDKKTEKSTNEKAEHAHLEYEDVNNKNAKNATDHITNHDSVVNAEQKQDNKYFENAAHKQAEIENIGKPTNDEAEDVNVENGVCKEAVDENVENAQLDYVEKASNKEADDNVKNVANRTYIDDIIVSPVHKQAGDENVENATSDRPKDENVEEALSNEAGQEIVEKVAFDKAVDDNVEKAACDKEDDNVEKAAGDKAGDENVVNAEDDNVERAAGDKADEDVEKSAGDPKKGVNIEKAAGDQTKDENIEKTAGDKAEDENVEKTAGDKAEDENVEKRAGDQTEDDNVEKTAGDKGEDENFEKRAGDQTEDENVEKTAGDKGEDENIEKAPDDKTKDENIENSAGDKAEDESVEIADNKVEDDNIENAAGDKAEDEKAAADENENVMDILGNGLLKKKVLVPGKGEHTRPTNGDIVTLKVDGQLPDGTHVDTGEITFTLNDGDVILAFDLAVSLMEEGEKCELFTSERYAYGSVGRDPDIPKDTSVSYVLELVNVQRPPDVSELTYDQRLKIGESKRERGNYLFGRTDYTGAINSYNKAVKLLDNPELNDRIDESSRAVITESWVKCYNNLAACQLKIDALDSAIKSCEKVLSEQKDNVKALFRLGKAYGARGEIDQALTYLRRAIKLDPESKLMQQEMLNLTRRKNKETATEKELYQRMLGVKPGERPSMTDDKRKNNSNKLIKWTLVVGGIAAVLISVGINWYRAS